MTLTAAQWATAVRPLLDQGIVEVPMYRVDGAGDIVREVYNSFGDVIGHCEIEADGRLAFLAVIEGKLMEARWTLERYDELWVNERSYAAEDIMDPDRETAALRAAYAQWPELGEWPL
jgi:hypothetical protein